MKIEIFDSKHNSYEFIIDEEDKCIFDEWDAKVRHNGSDKLYIELKKTEGPIRMITYYHRYLLNCPEDMVVDHINSDTFDNRKENLRICSQQQNRLNNVKTRNKCYSNFIGVTWNKAVSKWQAKLHRTYLGRFDDEVLAAKAVDTKAREVYGKYAKLNFPDCEEKVVGKIKQKKTSKYRGVFLDNKTKKWLVKTMINGETFYGGSIYDNEEDAARRYNELTIEHRKNPNPYLNVIDD